MFKYRISSTLVLNLLEGTEGFVVCCDVYRVGLESIIMQHG